MPSSTIDCIEPVLRLIIDMSPQSVLDLGVGFGKWGFLAREYIEINANHVYAREDWQARIDGVEAFKPYIQDHHRVIYDNLYIRNLDEIETHKWLAGTKYQLYLATDVLEHLYHWQDVLNAIPADRTIIAVVPNGVSRQGQIFGNVCEQHVVTFGFEDFKDYFDSVTIIDRKLLCVRVGKFSKK